MRTLKQVATNMADAFTRFGLWKGGGSGGSSQVVYGGIDVNNVIYELTNSVEGTEWVATEDCYFIGELVSQNVGCYLMIDGVSVAVNYCSSVSSIYFPIFILKGQTIKYFAISNNYIRTAKIYGVKKSENILHEYSTEEKVVGKWIDGKPIYEKVIQTTFSIGYTIIPVSDIKYLINIYGTLDIGGSLRPFPFVQRDTTSKVVLNNYDSTNLKIDSSWNCTDVYLVIQYTKTTD